jgi:arylsulfatase A-like enzyme
MHLRRTLLASTAVALTLTCGGGGGGTVEPPAETQPTNVLLIVADDFGVDMFSPYAVHPSPAPTPNLTALAAEGVLFEYFYSLPSCSPTRAALLTGRMPFRHGIGKPIDHWRPEHALALDERTLPEILKDGSATPVATSAIGKWHLGSESIGGEAHPNLQGFDWFSGTLGNLVFGSTYFGHQKVTNGVVEASRTYVTSEQVDDALARIEAMPEPWFLYLGFNTPHTPLHAPPSSLHTQELSGDPGATPNAHYRAMVEAMDRELGRLFAGIPERVRANTTIVFLGDNGTPGNVMVAPSLPGNSKGSVYEGGVRVPMIIAGKHVDAPGTRCSNFVQAVDLFPSIIELMGADLAQGLGDTRPIDGISIVPYLTDPAAAPLREFAVAERFSPNGFAAYTSYGAMVRDARWKLVRRDGQPDALFDMLDSQGDPLAFEDPATGNLNDGELSAEESAALARLQAALSAAIPGQ